MRKGLKTALAAVLGLVLAVMTALDVALNSSLVTEMIEEFGSERIDGELSFKKPRVSVFGSFPRIRVTVRDVSVTYSHDRFAVWDGAGMPGRLPDAGRGETADTLVAFDRFTASVNLWHIFAGRLRLSEASVSGLSAYIHKYGPEESNTDILRFGTGPDGTADKSPDLPWISVGDISIEDPWLVYTDCADTVYAGLRFDALRLGGSVKVSPQAVRLRGVRMELDSLLIMGRLPKDTLSLRIDRLRVDEAVRDRYAISLDGETLAVTSAFGRMDVPFSLESLCSLSLGAEKKSLSLQKFDAEIASLPLTVSGKADVWRDSAAVKVCAAVTDYPVDSLLRNYLDRFSDVVREITTDAMLTVSLDADGVYSPASYPAVEACLRIPEARLHYAPLGADGKLTADVDAFFSSEGELSADIRELRASLPGLRVDVDASAENLLGADPLYDFSADLVADLGALMPYIPESFGVGNVSGDIDFGLKARLRQSELADLKFAGASVSGSLSSSRLELALPSDRMAASLFNTDIGISSRYSGLRLDFKLDSLHFDMGEDVALRVRDFSSRASVTKVASGGSRLPKMDIEAGNGSIFARRGTDRIGVRGAKVSASVQKRARLGLEKRKHLLDSLQTVYPGIPRNALLMEMRLRDSGRPLPDFLTERDFEKADIDISLDSALVRMVRGWDGALDIAADAGFLASARLPLRTRLYSLDAGFDGDEIKIDSLTLLCGTSDVSARGRLSGLRSALRRKGLLNAELDLHSGFLNINELAAAVRHAQENALPTETASVAEFDESFVTDTLADASYNGLGRGLIVVPANIVARMGVKADSVRFSDRMIRPLSTGVRVQERTLQLTETSIGTDFGDIGLDAYYSTRTKEDISVGFNVSLKDMSAHDIIYLLPQVDSLIPALKSFEGSLGATLSATARLDTSMNVIVPTIDAIARISGRNLEIRDAGSLERVTRLLMFRNRNIGHIDDLNVNAVVHDSRAEIFPFDLGVDRYRLAISGTQDFDRSMYYHISILHSPFILRFGINIFGTWDNWRFSLGRAKYKDGNVPSYTAQIDSAQNNFMQSIRDIYDSGIDEVLMHNRRNVASVADIAIVSGVPSAEALSPGEFSSIDNMLLEQELLDQAMRLEEDVDRILEETLDISRLVKDYGQKVDRKTALKIERLKNKSKK